MNYLENLLKGNIASFKKNIESKLAEKVFEKLAHRKQQIANGLFEAEKLQTTSLEQLQKVYNPNIKGWKIGDPHPKYTDSKYVIDDYKNAGFYPVEKRNEARKNLLDNYGHLLSLSDTIHLRNWEAAGEDPDSEHVLRRTESLQKLYNKKLLE